MGLAQSVPGTHDVSVRISNSFHAPHINANYSEALRGYISEMEWHHITTSLETVTAAAGSAEQVAGRTWTYFGSLVVFILSFFATTIMTPIGCALGGWGPWCMAGVGLGAVCGVSLIVFIILAIMGGAAGRRWTSAAIQAVDTQLLPDLRARHPIMSFELRDLQPHSFALHIERLPEERDSSGQVVVTGVAVEAQPQVLVASAPTPDALGGKSQSGGQVGGGGLGAPLLQS